MANHPSYLLAKGEGSSYNINGFPAKSILKLKWAWPAQFLHHTLKILQRATTFVDVQMMLLSFFDIFTCVRFRKSMWESSVHILRRPWIRLTFLEPLWHEESHGICSFFQSRSYQNHFWQCPPFYLDLTYFNSNFVFFEKIMLGSDGFGQNWI